ncbi:MAG TPA: acyl-CoA ligase (AMP-forming), exosortase A system-associated [Steroidobacteraceae bacterium]|nr:acyl-CoA ligase (AMP-forming), exosortase A system-associated [Steroidobacteraceae bacterium]
MSELLHELPLRSAARTPLAPALRFRGDVLGYAEFATHIETFGRALVANRVSRQDRVAIFLPKQIENVVAMFGTASAGCVFVPVNPVLKPPQVGHILRDCNVRVLVTSAQRAEELQAELAGCPDIKQLVLVGDRAQLRSSSALPTARWTDFMASGTARPAHRVIDADIASIFYTSGSTGKPKGVVLSHRNMVAGAESVASYLENSPADRILAVLPFSFDYGFSQLSTAFHVGACVSMLDHLFGRDVLAAVARDGITGLAGVPPLWLQLADLPWPAEASASLRYITNSGGAMPATTLQKLRTALPRTRPFLMYGLTEAFRSTYLPPEEIDRRPGSIGRAIPNAEVMIVRPDGTRCAANEPGELVHRGALVSLGYWNDPQKTAERFKPVPSPEPGLVLTELAVWSGDTARSDEDGYLYFIGRRDEMIKTSGYRVSPTEIEEIVYATGLAADAVAIGVADAQLGQAIVVVAVPAAGAAPDTDRLLIECRTRMPTYMIPARIEWRESLPRNPNGKFDRVRIAQELKSTAAGAVA